MDEKRIRILEPTDHRTIAEYLRELCRTKPNVHVQIHNNGVHPESTFIYDGEAVEVYDRLRSRIGSEKFLAIRNFVLNTTLWLCIIQVGGWYDRKTKTQSDLYEIIVHDRMERKSE